MAVSPEIAFLVYISYYLNEFIDKLNRRYFGDELFDRLVIANTTGLDK